MNMDPSHTATLLASDYVGDAQIVVTVIVAAIGALFAAAYLFVARAIWKGRSWPRKVSPFLAVLSLPALFIGPVAMPRYAPGLSPPRRRGCPRRAFAAHSRADVAATRARPRAPTAP